MVAALTPTAFVTALAIPLVTLATGNFMSVEQQPDAAKMQVFQMAIPAQLFLSALFATIVPSTIAVCATHAIARSLSRLRGRDYALIGAAVGCTVALLLAMVVSPLLLFPTAAMVGALMGASYRRLAGLEPLALPEPIMVNDTAELVDTDHPARRQHVVLTDG